MDLKRASRVSGAIHDVARLQALSPDECHVLFVSSRTLSILNNISENELAYVSRYALEIGNPPGYYRPVRADDAELEFVSQVVQAAKRELIPMTCDLTTTLNQLTAAINAMSGSGCCEVSETVQGQYQDPGDDIDGTGSPPPGLEDTDPELSEKCQLANWFYVNTLAIFEDVEAANVFELLALSVIIGASAILAILTGGAIVPVFLALITGQLGAWSAWVDTLLDITQPDLQGIITAMQADRSGFVCALYEASDNGEARSNLDTWASNAGLSAAQRAVILALMNNYVLAALFFPTQDQLTSAAADTTGYTDCANECGAAGECPFVLNVGTGSFLYDGTEFVITSASVGDYHSINFSHACCADGGNWCLQVVAYTIDDQRNDFSRSMWGYGPACNLALKDYQPENPSMPALNVNHATGAVEFNDASAFTITFKIVGRAGPLGAGENPLTYSGTCE